jgi:hydrogenase expression/formation protein HypE
VTDDAQHVQLAHGAGGRAMTQFLEGVVLPHFHRNKCSGGIGLPEADDGATIPLETQEIVVSTDSHTVSPLFFAGGDIGRLAVAGSVNDVAMMGAQPLALTSALVIEEGFLIADLHRILDSMETAANEVEVAVIAGDTKVMPKGNLDQLIICTTGIGLVPRGRAIADSGIRPGDKIIVTGTVGDHGIALLAQREGLAFETTLISDVAPIWLSIRAALTVGGIHAMKDPTRGGVAGALNELASKSKVTLEIEEEKIPIRREVLAASQMLGIDPLDVTCEGKAILAVDSAKAETILRAVRATRYGAKAEIIGEAKRERPGLVTMRTTVGGTRVVQHPWAEAIPRVC